MLVGSHRAVACSDGDGLAPRPGQGKHPLQPGQTKYRRRRRLRAKVNTPNSSKATRVIANMALLEVIAENAARSKKLKGKIYKLEANS